MILWTKAVEFAHSTCLGAFFMTLQFYLQAKVMREDSATASSACSGGFFCCSPNWFQLSFDEASHGIKLLLRWCGAVMDPTCLSVLSIGHHNTKTQRCKPLPYTFLMALPPAGLERPPKLFLLSNQINSKVCFIPVLPSQELEAILLTARF